MGIDRTLEGIHGFDAASTDRRFRVAVSELGEIGWLPATFAAVNEVAPHARIEIVPLDVAALPDWLDRGSVDVAITPAELPAQFERTTVKTEEYGVVMSSRNRLAYRGFAEDDYRRALRVAVAGDSGAPLVEAAHARLGGVSDAMVYVQHFATLPPLLIRVPELVATIPKSIALGWSTTWPLVIRELPFEMPPITLKLYRRNTTQHAGALEWLFRIVADAVTRSSGEFSVIQADHAPVR